jgi:hypothetical protein
LRRASRRRLRPPRCRPFSAGRISSSRKAGTSRRCPAGRVLAADLLPGSARLAEHRDGSLALTGYETNGVAQTAGQWNLTDIYVPYYKTWTGAAVLQGTTVTTNKLIVALYGSNGALIANSAVAGVLTTTASTFLNCPFTAKVNLAPGRYIIGVQATETTDTIRHILARTVLRFRAESVTGTFATVPATLRPRSR